MLDKWVQVYNSKVLVRRRGADCLWQITRQGQNYFAPNLIWRCTLGGLA